MKFLDYIKGLRKGKDAHRIERKAMEDSFLSDALDGYDSVEGNHLERIGRLQKLTLEKSQSRHVSFRVWSIAATILICMSIGGYFLVVNQKNAELKSIAMVETEKSAETKEEVEELSQIKADRLSKQAPIVADKKEFAPILQERVEIAEENKAMADMSAASAISIDTIAPPAAPVQAEPESSAKQAFVAKEQSFENRESAKMAKAVKPESAKPQPVIGMKAYQDYLKKNIIRPTDKACAKKKGTVVLEFSVNSEGKPVDVHVKKGICPGADAEAIRLLNEGCLWTIGERRVELEVKM